jgi:Fe-Mn family superoxide dismutase
MKRRDFIEKTALTVGGLMVTSSAFGLPKPNYDRMVFELPKLPYSYDALEPFIDRLTMEIHHSKHHQGYVNKLNKALEGTKERILSLSDILKKISKYSTSVRNNAGGHYNHSLFWTLLTPVKNTKPSEKLQIQINKQFESLDNLKELINEAAAKRFGSGWAWLSVDNNGELFVSSTPNQDNPLMNITEQQGRPILGIDVWEHAYYLKYQNKRGDYLSAIWNVVDWREVSNGYENDK